MTTTAASVSAALRRLGFRPVSPSDWNREGLKARQSGSTVRVVADLDHEGAAKRLADEARTALNEDGYSVTDLDASAGFFVTR